MPCNRVLTDCLWLKPKTWPATGICAHQLQDHNLSNQHCLFVRMLLVEHFGCFACACAMVTVAGVLMPMTLKCCCTACNSSGKSRLHRSDIWQCQLAQCTLEATWLILVSYIAPCLDQSGRVRSKLYAVHCIRPVQHDGCPSLSCLRAR